MRGMKPLLLFTTVLLFLQCNTRPEASLAVDAEADYYTEKHRPQFHFSPKEKWMNDPNGMVYYEGEYHLFYQYYPDSNVWGPMHWGHAVGAEVLA